jgi:hypothetical protein
LFPESIFHERWWLSAVSQGREQEATVTNGDQVVGRLPYIIQRTAGLTIVRMPPFTHLLGPAVDAGPGKPQTKLLRRLSIVRDLLNQLPRFDYFKQAMAVTTIDGLAFQDCGFEISHQYTFQIDCRRDPKDLWQDMHSKTRQHIRRAEEKFTISTEDDPDRCVHFYKANIQGRGRKNRTDFSSFGGLFRECRTRDCGEIIRASWPDGTPTAMIFLVWDRSTMYYLLSTRAADAGDNGSVNLLIWNAILRAHNRGLILDLDGVISSGTARFLSGFGGRPEIRVIAQRSSLMYSILRYGKRQIIGGKATETTLFT